MIQDYISIDLETTGLNPKEDAIIEIGAVKVRNGEITEEFQTFVNPHRIIPKHVMELTGIGLKDVEKERDFPQIMPELLEFLGEDVLVGHSILFDYSFLKRAVVNHSKNANSKECFEKKAIDTLRLSRVFLPQLENKRLETMCDYYEISLHAHRALEDARATAMLYQKLSTQFEVDEESKKIFAPYHLIYKVKKEGPATPAQKERLYNLLNKHNIILEKEIDSLTKNEASRYLDRILAEYGR